MGDYKSLPAWKRGMGLAHSIYAAAEEADLKGTDAGMRLRKTAVSVPSLIGEAFMDLGHREPEETLFMAESRLSELEKLLNESGSVAIPQTDREDFLSEIELLRQDLDELRMAKAERN